MSLKSGTSVLDNGAGFIVAIAGDMMTMPGLPKAPAAERIDIDNNGKITGPFLTTSRGRHELLLPLCQVTP